MKTPDEIYLFENGEEIVWADTDESHELDESVAYVKMEKYKELEQQNAELVNDYKEIQEQRDQLQSLVFNLKNAIAYSLDYLHVNGEMTTIGYHSKCHKELLEADSQTPKQSLANIKADAIEDMVSKHELDVSTKIAIKRYIKQLREQSK